MKFSEKLWEEFAKEREPLEVKQSGLRKLMEKSGTKTQSDYKKLYPSFQALLAEDEEVRVRLQQGLAWGEFMLSLLTNTEEHKEDPVASFFTRSSTHRVLFYTLFVTALERILHCPQGQNPDSIGQAIPEVWSVMHKAEFSGESKIREICREALKLKLIHKTHWRTDKRLKLYWISSKAVASYLTTILEDFSRANEGLPAARVALVSAIEANPNFEADVRARLEAAIEADNKTGEIHQ